MQLLSNLWRLDFVQAARSLTDAIDNFVYFLESLAKQKFWRFILGSIIGIVPALIYWGYAIFFHINIPLTQAIIGSLILMLAFGIAAVYGKLERLFESLML